MSSLDLSLVSKIIADVAASEIMPRFQKLQAGDVEMKGVNDPVTVADKAAEELLTQRLTGAFANSVVVGEESFAADPRILSRLSGDADVWIIDPIDGTRNFIEGKPEFGVMVGLVRNKQTVAGWIYDPNTQQMLSGEYGAGVWLSANNHHYKMSLAGQDATLPKEGIIGSRLKKLMSQPGAAEMLATLPPLQTGSAAAFDYGRLFTGDVLFGNSQMSRVAYLLYRMSKAWDHVPGLFLVNEAGGYAADLLGGAYDMQNGSLGLLVAPDKGNWEAFHKGFNPLIEGLIRTESPTA